MGFNVDIKFDLNKVDPSILLFILAFFGLWAGEHYQITLIRSFSILTILGLFIYALYVFMFRLLKELDK